MIAARRREAPAGDSLPPASYAIYVVLTCVFYYVGLAYDNVPEVTLFVLFMGGLEAAFHAGRWWASLQCRSGSPRSRAPDDPSTA